MAGLLLQATLWIWFLGCIVTYRAGRFLLVEGMGLRSAESAMLCLYSLGLVLFYTVRPAGRWILFSVLALWFGVQFFCHWSYTLFGASEEKLAGYNECFRDTVRLFPASDKRLVPDLYHIILHLLILANLVFCLAR